MNHASYLTAIEQELQRFLDVLAELIDLEFTVVNDKLVRIAGTGSYKEQIGSIAPEGSLFQNVLETGIPRFILDIQNEEENCRNCVFNRHCRELSTMGYPIILDNRPIGVIGIIAFSPQQKEKVVENLSTLWDLLKQTHQFIENKIALFETADSPKALPPAEPVQNAIIFQDIIGYDTSLKDIVKRAERVTSSPSAVLIQGEAGTGKEQLAKALHYGGNRASASFIPISCSAVPAEVLERELFGYGDDEPGWLEKAANGTVFFDEIGDLPLSLQAKLQRALQVGSIYRVNGSRSLSINVRIIAATSKNLEQMIQEGMFREDFYYQINVLPFTLPPLKERKEDILKLFTFFLKKHGERLNKPMMKVEPIVEQWLLHHQWPGNIRQLENVAEYLVNFAQDDVITSGDLPDSFFQKEKVLHPDKVRSLDELVAEYEKTILQQLLESAHSTSEKEKVANDLNISLSTLYRKLEKYQIS
ncbi:sigma-54 interaction domain-containing protein [Halalkalibacter oceani]|uniref:Sigma 54-interacting transcriptional regulator n=1 Tax=Halalkalibacter oceani TaxID=1653776 RepID=A0A9X2DLA3_9BACI|nr:sigma 54-interacting transcriptional regulator [Halalkalibacter oceani]MCM3712546.1 sigma 54-interacting transcriptional regulator [Halalkalibacter oceani]